MGCKQSFPINRNQNIQLLQLPDPLLNTILSYLNGMEIYHLSHVCVLLHSYLNFESDNLWSLRVEETKRLAKYANKKAYFQARSIYFYGTSKSSLKYPSFRNDAWVALTKSVLFPSTRHDSRSFSIDVWFSIAEDRDQECYQGGCILGCQSTSVSLNAQPKYFQTFIHVDNSLNLYCSILSTSRTLVKLQALKWYHLALTCHPVENDIQRHEPVTFQQSVYLQGKLIDTSYDVLHSKWKAMQYIQVGTGYTIFPELKSNGWYSFHGTIDSLRIWNRKKLMSNEITQLADDYTSRYPRTSFNLCACNTRFLNEAGHDIQVIRCTRPWEAVCTPIQTEKELHGSNRISRATITKWLS